LVFKKLTNLLGKLVAVNSLVILLVIIITAFSVTNYACYLVNSKQIIGQEFVKTLNIFLAFVSIIAFILANFFHYITAKKILQPIHLLSKATKEIKNGQLPSKIDVSTSDEMNELIMNFHSMSEKLFSIQKSRDNMLRDIAHELRTPLTNINGYLEALENQVIEADVALYGSLLDESRRITRIVDMITELNSWENENYFFDKKFKKVEIEEVLQAAITTFHLRLKEQFDDLCIKINPAQIEGNKDGLIQVFTNLLQNVIQYNNGHHLEIKGEIQNTNYRISFNHKGQYIDPVNKQLLFERFFRQEESRTTKSPSAGLGLAISKSIILAHRGTIDITTDGLHHSFWIEIPLLSTEKLKENDLS